MLSKCRERQLKKTRNTSRVLSNYMYPSFVLGSVAEVERLWSVAVYILRDNRYSLTSKVFEVLIFLKLNERILDEHLLERPITW